MNRRSFIKLGSGAMMLSTMAHGVRAEGKAKVPDFAKGAEEMEPVLKDVEVLANDAIKGNTASFFIDDTIWVMRDLTRQRPKSLFDNPFMKPLKECHDRYGLKLQLNLFYRTDFYYNMDDFSLADMTDAYKAEWQSAKDWLRLGFHSMQEFPELPWINMDYAGVKKMFDMTHREIGRFAGEGVFTTALVPHWCLMSRDGCRALADCGIKLMECTAGTRYAYDDRWASVVRKGYIGRLKRNRRPEAAVLCEEKRSSPFLCSYNNMSMEQLGATANTRRYVLDRDTGMRFKHLFGDAPILNHKPVPELEKAIGPLIGKEHLVFSDHEQYFYSDYGGYQPDYADRIRKMSSMMHGNGYSFLLNEELIGV